MDSAAEPASPSHHRRQPSINSQDFVVRGVSLTEDDNNSTDSYESQDEDPTPFDPVGYLTNSLNTALTRLEFNKSMAKQAQMSGKLKGKEAELLALHEEAQQRLLEFQQSFKKGIKTLQQVSKDLKYSKQKVQQLTTHVQAKYPIEYSQAKDKVVSRNISPAEFGKDNDDDDEEIYI